MLAGQEYTVVGWCENRLILRDASLLRGLLEDICQRISMRSLGSLGVDVPVELCKLGLDQFQDEGGSSASLILSTSHMSIHGWPDRKLGEVDGGFFWFTIGSCREFDVGVVENVLSKVLHVTVANRYKRWINVSEDSSLFHSEVKDEQC